MEKSKKKESEKGTLFGSARIQWMPIAVILLTFLIAAAGKQYLEVRSDILFEKAEVTKITSEDLQADDMIPDLSIGTQQLQLKILTGSYAGEIFHIKNPISRLYNVKAEAGKTVIVRMIMEDDLVNRVSVFNYNRGPVLYVLAGLFFLLLILQAGMKGVRAIVSLIFTGVMLIYFMLPLLLRGYHPIPLTLITVVVVTIVTFLLIGRWHKKTLSAILGTIAGVTAAGVTAYIAAKAAHLSGITTSEAEELIFLAGDLGVKVQGLMFSAILIASLGAVMDVAMSITSTIFELYEVNPNLTFSERFKSGMNVGRDITGTMSNTLILAFAGGSLNTMLIIAAYQMPYLQIINLDFIGSELILSLSGSIGIVLTVPISAIAASLLTNSTKGGDVIKTKGAL